MKTRAVLGVLSLIAGAIWIAQGSGALHGSSMTGEGQWTVIGIVLVVVGAALVISSRRARQRNT